MSFEIEMAMAVLENLSPDEQEVLFTAAKFLMSTSSADGGNNYAFTAIRVSNIKIVQSDLEPLPIQSDLGEYRFLARQHKKPKILVSFECDGDSFFGTLLKVAAPKVTKPLTPEEEEKELEELLGKINFKREERAGLIL